MSGSFVGFAALTRWLEPAHWEDVLGAIVIVVVLALVLERGLSLFFEWGVWKEWLERKKLRGPLAFAAAYFTCLYGKFDLLAILFAKAEGWSSPASFGVFATAAIIAGGSKGAVLLFQGLLGFSAEAVDARVKLATQKAPAAPALPAPSASLPAATGVMAPAVIPAPAP
jgi:hypothetical protein